MPTDTKWFDAYIPDCRADEEDYGRQRKDKAHPEIYLASAVMERALMDLCSTAEERADALAWINSTDQSYPFAFESLCVLLRLDPEATRAQILTTKVDYMALFRRPTLKLQVSVQMRQQSRRKRRVGEVAA